MANMFSGYNKKEIPKNMEDCIKPDSVSSNLWGWCEWLEKWGKILFWVLIVGGLILSISTSIVEKEVVVREATYWSEAETELRKTFDFEIFIPLLLETALYAFLEYCAYHILALLIGALASIVQNTKISANVALYNTTYNSIDKVLNNNQNENYTTTNKNDTETISPQTENKGTVKIQSIVVSNISNNDKCSRCGDIVDVYESEVKKPFGTAHQKLCKECLKKYEQEEYIIIEKNDNNNHKWRCSRCGEMINTKTCPYCGMKFE